MAGWDLTIERVKFSMWFRTFLKNPRVFSPSLPTFLSASASFSAAVVTLLVFCSTVLNTLPCWSRICVVFWICFDASPIAPPLPIPFSALSVRLAWFSMSFSGPLALSSRTNAASMLTIG